MLACFMKTHIIIAKEEKPKVLEYRKTLFQNKTKFIAFEWEDNLNLKNALMKIDVEVGM